MKKIILMTVICLNVSTPVFAEELEACQKLMVIHGYLSRSQFQCGFRSYSQRILNAARSCARDMSEMESKDLLMQGMKEFDTDEKAKGGRANICSWALKQYSWALKR